MFPSDLNNAYAYEQERRKDEMRSAAMNHTARKYSKKGKTVMMPVAILSIFTLLLTVLLGS